jgi:hypothetical protein
MSHPIPIGAKVQVERLPPDLDTFPEETQAAFRAALGKTFVLRGYGPYGHLELELGRELDALLGGFMNTIWIEGRACGRLVRGNRSVPCLCSPTARKLTLGPKAA